MDNRSIDITSEGRDHIRHALSIAWLGPNYKATHFAIRRVGRVIKYYANPASEKLPANAIGTELFRIHHFDQDTSVGSDQPGVKTLILLSMPEHDSQELPFPLSLEQATAFVGDWLESLDDKEFEPQPDHDGSNYRGWRMFTDCWGHVAEFHCGIVGVQPVWSMYGK